LGSCLEEGLPDRLDHRGWTAAQRVAPCVICRQAAIPRSQRGKPCHWTCAVAWVNEHQDQAEERGKRAA
jgi:hypothetical protein